MEIKRGSIAQGATRALAEHGERMARIARLRAELGGIETGSDPATPESLAKLTRYLCEAFAELEAVPQSQRLTPEFKLAEECLQMLCSEFDSQNNRLGVGKV